MTSQQTLMDLETIVQQRKAFYDAAAKDYADELEFDKSGITILQS